MKRLTSLLLTLALLLSMIPAAFAAGPETPTAPDKIDASTTWSYLDDGTDPAGGSGAAGYDRTSWTAADFDDSAWKTASGSFGAKNGGAYNSSTNVLLEGCPGTADNYPTYYFRTTVNVANTSAVTKITGSISYDDAAIIYINGVKAAAFNEDGITGNNSYCTNKANTTETFEITDAAVLAALVNGDNVIAVELHNQYENSSDIWFAMSDMTFSTEALPVENTLMNGSEQWTYLDDNTDPAGDATAAGYERTSWTAEAFDTTNWKTAAGPFGSKKGAAALETGYTASTILAGCDGSNDTPAYFLRTTFNVNSLDGMTKLTGTLQYDDGVIVYINGQRVASFDDNACGASGNSLGYGFNANLQYGGSNAGTPKTVSFELLDLSILHTGENTIAVELHNGRQTSSDVWFHLTDLSLSDEEVVYQTNISLSMGADESRMNFTWYSPLENASLTVADNADLTGAQTVAATASTANDGQYSCKATVTGLKANTTYYYQLSNAGHTSEVYHFTTGGNGDFSFAYVGDPQIGASGNAASDTVGWENTLNIIDTNDIFSDVSFLLSAGDQVNTASSESEYDGYLDHNALLGLPVATVIGNHDSSSNAYGQHFNIANESNTLGTTTAGGDSWFVYNNVLFLVLNSNDMSAAEHKEFMQAAIAANPDVEWKIVTFHHSIYTVASHSSDSYITDPTGFKNSMAPIFKELDIDVVLQGHDHVYCRTYMMDGLNPITESEKYEYANGADQAPTAVTDPDGILYVTANSGSGSKTYNIVNAEFPFSAVQNQEHVPNVSKISVSDSQFTITTYRTTDMSMVDSFTIKRTAAEDEGYKVTFVADEYSTIDVYYTQDYTAANESNVTAAYARSSSTGEIDTSGDGQVNFKVTVDEGYELVSVTADANYKNLKDSADTKAEGVYRLTKITGDVTVTITTKSAGSGEPAEPEEPTYTPVVTGDIRVNGYYDETGSLQLELAGRYNSGAMNADGGSLEIVQYNPANGFAYAVSGVKGKLIAVDLNESLDGDKVVVLTGTEYDLKSTVSVNGFIYGDMTSVAISPDGSKLAVAIQAEGYADPGVVALFACNADGSLELLSTVTVGVQPDMVTFADNDTILSADEGEPRGGATAADPKGSVTIVAVGADNKLTAKTVYFDSFDAQRDALTAAGVLVQKDTNPSTDFEPEYIAVSGSTAYVSLQEANAIAVLDIPSGTFTGVYPLGFQDYSKTTVDLQKDGEIKLTTYENVYGIKMPDGISVTTIGGKTYLLTANEGDSRADWDGLDNESESKTSPTGNVTLDAKVVWFNAEMWDGLDTGKAYVFGGRSFSIYEVTATGLTLVYDSGSGFEEITAAQLPAYFNTSNDKNSADNRSGKKGPEPESVVTGAVDGKTYAFIALERIGGVMVYDITDPANAFFVNYINSREFENVIQGDVSPEGLCFVPAADSKTSKALLLTACEVSGTLAAYELTGTTQSGGDEGGSSGSTVSYPVSAQQPANGAVTLSSGSASKGAAVTITAAPSEGYKLASLTVTDANGNVLALNQISETTFTFTMPASKVTVNAVFDPVSDNWTNPYTDVAEDIWYYDAVRYVTEKGLMNGVNTDSFAPNAITTRGMIVTILYRLENEPAAGKCGFTDVYAGQWYTDAVAWAAAAGIVNGYGDTFGPEDPITREQMAAILYRYASYKGCNVSAQADLSGYTDAGQISAYAVEAMRWANAEELITGVTASTLVPGGSAIRAQVAVILMRFCENLSK